MSTEENPQLPFEGPGIEASTIIKVDPQLSFEALGIEASGALKHLIKAFIKCPKKIYYIEDSKRIYLEPDELKLKSHKNKSKSKEPIEYWIEDDTSGKSIQLTRPIKKQIIDEKVSCWVVGNLLGQGGNGRVKSSSLKYVLGSNGTVQQVPSKIAIKTSLYKEVKKEVATKKELTIEADICNKYIGGKKGEEKASWQYRKVSGGVRYDLFVKEIDGNSLDTMLKDGTIGKMSYAQRLTLMRNIAQAVDQFHKLTNYAHLDIKPANIMVKKDGTITLIDFGSAKKIDSLLKGWSGTLRYMAPERCSNELYGINTELDRYSLALTFAEILLAKDKPITGSPQEISRLYGKTIKKFYNLLCSNNRNSKPDGDYNYSWLEQQLNEQQRELIPLLKQLTAKPGKRIAEEDFIRQLSDLAFLRSLEEKGFKKIKVDPQLTFEALGIEASGALKHLIKAFIKCPEKIYYIEDNKRIYLEQDELKLKSHKNKSKSKEPIEYWIEGDTDNKCIQLTKPIKKQIIDEKVSCWVVGNLLGQGGYGRVKSSSLKYELDDKKEVQQVPSKIAIKTSLYKEVKKEEDTKKGLTIEADICNKYIGGKKGEEKASWQYREVSGGFRPDLFIQEIDGKSLDTLLNNGAIGQMSYGQRLTLMLKIAKGLKEFQKKTDFGHYDVKPDNIMVDLENGVVKFIDYGCAEKIGSRSRYRNSGTWQYMARERLVSYPKNIAESDWYSLTLTFVEILLAGADPQSYEKAIDEFCATLFDSQKYRKRDGDYNYQKLEKQLNEEQRELIPLLKQLTVKPWKRIAKEEFIQKLRDLACLVNLEEQGFKINRTFIDSKKRILENLVYHKTTLKNYIKLAITSPDASKILGELLRQARRDNNRKAWDFLKTEMLEAIKDNANTNIELLDKTGYKDLLGLHFKSSNLFGDPKYTGSLMCRFFSSGKTKTLKEANKLIGERNEAKPTHKQRDCGFLSLLRMARP